MDRLERHTEQRVEPRTPVQPFNESFLLRPGTPTHSIYIAEYGDPKGTPVVFVHGTALPFDQSQLDFLRGSPARAIVFHQRGVGRSQPAGEVRESSTLHTIADMEALRIHLGLERWSVFGWSLGSTISTAYAQMNPTRTASLLLSGVFLGSDTEYLTVLKNDASANPEKWRKLSALTGIALSEDRLPKIIESLYERFCNADPSVRHEAMRAWLQRKADVTISPQEESYLRVNFHYRAHRYFVDSPELQRSIAALSHLPAVIVSGARDVMVMPQSSQTWATAHGSARVISVNDDHFFKGEEAQRLFPQMLKHLP